MKLVKLANLELGELVSMDSWFGAAFHDYHLCFMEERLTIRD